MSVWHDLKRMDIAVDIILDVGANIGQTAAEFANAWPKATVYSFEPVADTFAQLLTNTKPFRNVKCFNCAIGSVDGRAEIAIHPMSVLNSLDMNHDSPQPTETVIVETIDQFCKRQEITRIDLLKTDTEGFEAEVLAGASGMLAGSVRAVFVEVCLEPTPSRHNPLSEILQILTPFGFELAGIYDQTAHNGIKLVFANALFVQSAV